ncbi:uncharacterized protein LOC108144145 [Drosophila elegans]|uniref:uncharacterized protein LOC108144145 n=1 Tax=Drosophila elegans TaxID=30023 RepID=UPI0007E78C23|nr:uncharacterized protein LOC108144145 [Drosophila elegans]
MLNVLAFKGSDTKFIYSFQAFPKLKVIRRKVKEGLRYFQQQLKDLGGYALRTLPDNIMPRTVVYRTADGTRQLGGYLSRFIRNYVSTLNATLKVSWDLVPEEGITHLMDATKLSEMYDVDFPLVTSILSQNTLKQVVPMEVSSWFLILPMEPRLPRARFFVKFGFHNFIPLALLLSIVLSNAHRIELDLSPTWRFYVVGCKVLQGTLTQPFLLPKGLSVKLMIIYWIILLHGFFVSNYHTANLETWLVHPPAADPIMDWDEMRRRKMKVLVMSRELNYLRSSMGSELFDAHSDIFHTTTSKDFQKKRLLLDENYAYPVSTTLWPQLEQSQVRLSRPIFRRSREMVFAPFLVFNLPMPRNSVFYKSLKRYTALTHDSGLYRLWFRRSFYELVAIGKISYKEDRNHGLYCDLKWNDFYFVWIAYVVETSVSFLVFIMELLYHKWSVKKTPN